MRSSLFYSIVTVFLNYSNEERSILSLFTSRLWALQQLLQFLLEDLVGSLLCLYVVLVGLPIRLLLFFVLQLHLCDLLLQIVHLLLQFFGLALECADLVLHILLLLLGLQGPPHSECDGGFVESLVGLNGLDDAMRTDRI